LRDSGGKPQFLLRVFHFVWNAEMKRNKQSKINLFLTRITICFLTAIGKPLHHNRVCLSLCEVVSGHPLLYGKSCGFFGK